VSLSGERRLTATKRSTGKDLIQNDTHHASLSGLGVMTQQNKAFGKMGVTVVNGKDGAWRMASRAWTRLSPSSY